MNKLNIFLTCTEETSEDYDDVPITYNAVEAHLTIDAKPFLLNSGVILDIHHLLTQYTTPEEFYLHTCGCTVAGCAGIHDPVEMKTTDSTVQWIFPEVYYREHINPELLDTPDGPMVFTFDKADYMSILDNCVDEIAQLQKQDLPIVIMPATSPAESTLGIPIYNAISNSRIYLEQYWADQHNHAETYEGFHGKEFKLVFETQTWCLEASDLNYLVTESLGITDIDDKKKYAKDVLIPKLRQDPTLAVELLKSLNIEDVQHAASLDYASKNNVDYDLVACKQEWPLAASLVQLTERDF